jgi:probable F420-dependent oxidoreductase
VKTGIVLPVEGPAATRGSILRAAREAERLHAHSVWATDRILMPAAPPKGYPYSQERGAVAFDPARLWLEPVTVLGLVAGVTEHVQLGTNVLVLPYRQPVVLAQEFATLDRISEGRALLGIGTGWMEEEFAALGIPKRERGRRTDESIRLLRALWATRGPVTFAGTDTSFTEMTLAATPFRPAGPPILVGGNSPAALARVAHLGDGWLGADLEPAPAGEAVAQIRELCANLGRDPDRLVLSARRRIEPSRLGQPGPTAPFGMSAEQWVQEIGEYAEVGINLMVFDLLMLPDMIEAMNWLFSEVIDKVAPSEASV